MDIPIEDTKVILIAFMNTFKGQSKSKNFRSFIHDLPHEASYELLKTMEQDLQEIEAEGIKVDKKIFNELKQSVTKGLLDRKIKRGELS